MAGTINSLGIGSGILTSDVIDQLRAADESTIIKPLDNKVTLQGQKQEAFTLIDTLVTSFKSSVSALSFDSMYEGKTVNVTGGDALVSVETGSTAESFTLETTTLAKRDINQSGSFSDKSSLIANGDGIFEITIDGTTYNVGYTATTTLSELAQAITDEAGTKVQADILQTGSGAYSLILSSQDTGLDQNITINDVPTIPGSGLKDELYNDATSTSGFIDNQDAVDAAFIYNGVSITRETNEITDLVVGLSISLKTEGETANVKIEQDTQSIKTEFKLLAESYNTLRANLNDVVTSDREAGTMGVFNGDNFVKSIIKDINDILLSSDTSNQSLVNYGFEMDRYGVLSFNESDFDTKFTNDPTTAKEFFTGEFNATSGETTTGIFGSLNDKINEFTKFGGLFDNFESGIKTKNDALTEQRNRAIESLDSRYNIMTQRFIAYDSIISKLNSQFSSLSLLIQAEANSKN